MSSDFETYEQDFGTLTADVTNKIGRIPKLAGGKWLLNELVLAKQSCQEEINNTLNDSFMLMVCLLGILFRNVP